MKCFTSFFARRCDISRTGPYFDDHPFYQTMKRLFTLTLILLLPAFFIAKAEDDKAAQRKARRKAAEAAAPPPAAAAPAAAAPAAAAPATAPKK